MKAYTHYNRIKAANERVQSDTRISYAEHEQFRLLVRAILAEKDRAGIWLSEQMGRIIGTVSRRMAFRRNARPLDPRQTVIEHCWRGLIT